MANKKIKLKFFDDVAQVAEYVRMEMLASLEEDARNNADVRKELRKKFHDIDAVWSLLEAAPELLARLESMHARYGRLHDMISDCIEGGRINRDNLPDDYRALAKATRDCMIEDHLTAQLIARVKS